MYDVFLLIERKSLCSRSENVYTANSKLISTDVRYLVKMILKIVFGLFEIGNSIGRVALQV